jgi:hypothetical protein
MKFLHKAFVEFDPAVWWFIAWALTVPLYIGLQAWFGIAWKGRWRIVALIPLAGLVLVSIFVAAAGLTIPDRPPVDLGGVLAAPLAGLALFAPIGLVYEVIAGIVRLSVRRPAAAGPA